MDDKYYYYPTQTKNIMFIKGEKYVCLCNLCNERMKKGKIYTCEDFTVGSVYNSIWFIDEKSFTTDNDGFHISPFDCGSFVSLQKYRKLKLEKLNKINRKT